MNFAERLKKVIDESGVTREDFYVRVGISKSQLFNYLGGRSDPTLSFFQKLKAVFPYIDLDWLMTGSATNYTNSVIIADTQRDSAIEKINKYLEKISVEDRKALEQIAASLAQCQKGLKKTG